jgi:hypothetical protein
MYLSSALKYNTSASGTRSVRPRSWISRESWAPGCAPGALRERSAPLQRQLQPLQPHRLGQVVHRFDLEGLHGMLGMGRDKHHGRPPGQVA